MDLTNRINYFSFEMITNFIKGKIILDYKVKNVLGNTEIKNADYLFYNYINEMYYHLFLGKDLISLNNFSLTYFGMNDDAKFISGQEKVDIYRFEIYKHMGKLGARKLIQQEVNIKEIKLLCSSSWINKGLSAFENKFNVEPTRESIRHVKKLDESIFKKMTYPSKYVLILISK